MIYDKDEIAHGESYDISIGVIHVDGFPIDFSTDGWTASCRITKEKVGGEIILDTDLALDGNGVPKVTIDTGDSQWEPGIYFYDVRATDPDGYDHWSKLTQLTLRETNTPPSS